MAMRGCEVGRWLAVGVVLCVGSTGTGCGQRAECCDDGVIAECSCEPGSDCTFPPFVDCGGGVCVMGDRTCPGTDDDDAADDDTGDDDTGDDDTGDDDTSEAVPQLPIMIAAENYLDDRAELLAYRPFVVYAWATDPAIGDYENQVSILESIDDADVVEAIMFSSHETLEQKLSQPGHVQHLRDIGVTLLGYNSEGGMTPEEQMNHLDDPDPATNSVARFASIGEEHGFDVWWGPIRWTSDAVSDGALAAMFGAGLDGVGLQEQQAIEASCAQERIDAVADTAARYRALSDNPEFHVDVQLMSTRCANGDSYAQQACPGETVVAEYDHCMLLVDGIAGDASSLAVWASGSDDRHRLVGFIAEMRATLTP